MTKTSTIDTLIAQCQSDDADVRVSAVCKLEKLGKEHTARSGPAIEVLLTDPDWSVRNHAAGALGILGYAPARAAIEQMLLHDEEWVPRASAAEALGEIRDVGALGALEAALTDEFGPVRAYAANSIGLIGDTRMLPVLRARLVGETDPATRGNLLVAAIRLGDDQALDELFALSSETTDEVSHVSLFNAVDDLLWRCTPPIVIERAHELDRWLAEFGSDKLQARLAEIVADAARSQS